METRRLLTAAALGATLAIVPVALAADDHQPPPNLKDKYLDTRGAHSERPGPHTTTAGRHGTAGTVGGGVDEQSGSAAVYNTHPIEKPGHQPGPGAHDTPGQVVPPPAR
jgi:hypothetical protein